MTTKPHWQQPWEKRHRSVRVVCIECVKRSNVTLYGLTSEYRELIKTEKCIHCGKVGTLNTRDLAKTRMKPDTTLQLALFNSEKKQ